MNERDNRIEEVVDIMAEQLNFIEVMRKQGAIAGVVYSIEELKELLNKC